MVLPAVQNSIFADGILEPLRGCIAYDIAVGPALAANVTRRAFVDGIGQSAAGGIALVQGDFNLSGGLIPSGIGYEVHGLTHYAVTIVTATGLFSAVPADAALLALGADIWVQAYYAGQYYDLGMLEEFLGPYGSPTGLNNAPFIRRFGWPWMDTEQPFELEPGKNFWLEYKTLRGCAAGVTASVTYLFRVLMPSRRVAQGVSAVRQ